MVVIVVAAVLRSWQQRMWYRGSATPVTGLTALMWVVVKCSAVEAIVVEVDPDEADPPDEAGLSRGARRRLTGRWLTTRGVPEEAQVPGDREIAEEDLGESNLDAADGAGNVSLKFSPWREDSWLKSTLLPGKHAVSLVVVDGVLEGGELATV
ncbi:hypothetical protein OsJ_14485 [Oryza sativa Japonica Group]|uniref:Uncharacterized protein n=1 Tax=Oryza sativa subsp. japonica TaxID=39947 RepID=A3ASZ5_ORYSJ|nr:hypothetical protein OsJ_14485 [Oryza sativa Japonica Group]